jgi:hypothetical protein
VNLQTALSFPFKDTNWIIKLLIGGVLSLASLYPMVMGLLLGESALMRVFTYILFLLLLVAFFAPLGYAFSILKGALQGEPPRLPEWKGWDMLFKDGVKAFVVCLVYGIVIGLVSALVGMVLTRIPLIGAILSLLQIVIGILVLLAGPFIGIALCKLAETGQIVSSFKVLEILKELKDKAPEYISISLILLGIMEIIKISLGLNLYQYMLAARIFWRVSITFPLVGLLTPFVMFWILIVSSRMYGEAYAKKQAS